MTPWKHAESSSAKFGGAPQDYMQIHDWFDETKAFTGDWTHRALRHHSAGIQWACEKFGPVIETTQPPGVFKFIPTKLVAERHVEEDCGFLPTPQDWLNILKKNPADWMLRVGKNSKTTTMEISK